MSFDEWFEQWESPPSWLFCKDDFEGAARAAWDAALKEKEEENKPSVTQAVADAQRLREFAQLVMDNWPHGDVDGGDLQEAAIRCGLLEPQTRTEPCSEGCNCMDYYASDEWS